MRLTVKEELNEHIDGQLPMGADVLESKSPDLVQVSAYSAHMRVSLRTMNRMVSIEKPMSWRGLRPTVSIVATASQYPGMAPAQIKIQLPAAML
jgi:hypothetical protein